MNIAAFFKGIGHFMGRSFGIIRKIVPEDLLRAGIQHAQVAMLQELDNAGRRQFVITQLMRIPGVSESAARLVTELAVQHLKADVIDKAKGKAIEMLDADAERG